MEEQERDTLAALPESQVVSGPDGSDGAEAKGTEACLRPVEKRGPYIMSRAPPIHQKLQKHREMARKALKKKALTLGGPIMQQPRLGPKRNVKFNKGYTALSQNPEDALVSLDSDSDGELESQYSSGYSSSEVHPEVSRQLLKDGYRLDEIPDDEDLDLIPPKSLTASRCCCADIASCSVQ